MSQSGGEVAFELGCDGSTRRERISKTYLEDFEIRAAHDCGIV